MTYKSIDKKIFFVWILVYFSFAKMKKVLVNG